MDLNEVLAKRPVILQLLRFTAIGAINTALDFIVLNFLIAQYHIAVGAGVGFVNIPGFTLAVIQSYVWNRYWAFGDSQESSLWKKFLRLAIVAGVGVLAFFFVLLGAKSGATPLYFAMMFVVFAVVQVSLWMMFGFFKSQGLSAAPKSVVPYSLIAFLLVSLIGLGINSVVLGLFTHTFMVVKNAQLNANIGKLAATVFSLVWNFIGYKIFVFKK